MPTTPADSEWPLRSRSIGSMSEANATQRAAVMPTTVSTECHPYTMVGTATASTMAASSSTASSFL